MFDRRQKLGQLVIPVAQWRRRVYHGAAFEINQQPSVESWRVEWFQRRMPIR